MPLGGAGLDLDGTAHSYLFARPHFSGDGPGEGIYRHLSPRATTQPKTTRNKLACGWFMQTSCAEDSL